jgi:aerobic-type carbon monoxide dehydrogenase small subunit (CoxS/CutS family)
MLDEPLAGEKQPVTFTVNGEETTVLARTQNSLLEVLREQERLFGVREGCGVGMCGACTVLVDGQPQSGCLILAVSAEGRQLTTVEGLEDEDGILNDLQQAFLRHTAFQCSYCTPGFLMASMRLLEDLPDATRDEVQHYLGGNLCRCGSYVKILDAVMDALASRRAARSAADA